MANSFRILTIAAASALMTSAPGNATAIIARTPSISGNGWVALGIIGGFVAVVYTLIAGALHVERRDARLGRRPGGAEHGWFGTVVSDDDDDGYDHGGEGH